MLMCVLIPCYGTAVPSKITEYSKKPLFQEKLEKFSSLLFAITHDKEDLHNFFCV